MLNFSFSIRLSYFVYRLSYGEYMLNELIKRNITGTKLYIMYDIACMLKKH